MNKVFKDFLDTFMIVFIDDILVYSKINEEYKFHQSGVERIDFLRPQVVGVRDLYGSS